MPSDLEERTYQFVKNVRKFTKDLDNKSLFVSDIRQLIRSSASVGANYIEANEALGKKDFLMRLRIARKEAKESAFFIKLIIESHELKNLETAKLLYNESIEIKKILSSIIQKSSN